MQADSGRRRSFFGLKLRKTQQQPSDPYLYDQLVPTVREPRRSSDDMETGWQSHPARQASAEVPMSCRHPSDMSSATDVSFEAARQAGQLRRGEEAQRPLHQARSSGDLDALRRPSEGLPATEAILNGRFRVFRDLAKGESGLVQQAVELYTGQSVAIKLIDRTRQLYDPKVVIRELQNQYMCAGHPNIVELREVFLTEQHLAIVMEYADGGDLARYTDALMRCTGRALPEPAARAIFQQLMVAVDYCHRLGIANRDIKLDNLLLHGGSQLKMADFGFSKDTLGQSTCKSSCGTPEYIAPELLFSGKYDGTRADTWSCGVTLYVLLTGRFPFSWPEDVVPGDSHATKVQRMFARITAGSYMPMAEVSMGCRDLIDRMLVPQPQHRATAAEVMRHPWFRFGFGEPLASMNDALLERAAAGAEGPHPCHQTPTELVSLVMSSKAARPSEERLVRRRHGKVPGAYE